MVDPTIITFGTIGLGESVTRAVRLTSQDGTGVDVKVLNKPADCTVEVEKKGAITELTVTAKPSTSGIWKGLISASVHNASWNGSIDISCVGITQPGP